ncbi:MAG: peptidoglycan-binding protein [Synergistaceae bacterium]|nr:peptidoglycan-binding protein [Synergistaceae bacterium]
MKTDYAVGRFNELVEDYNQRGGQFKYFDRDMQRARRDVEAARSQIELKAVRQARLWEKLGQASDASAGSVNNGSTEDAKTEDAKGDKPDLSRADVKEIQRLLKDLGCNPGSIDGKVGAKTELAVKAFQKSENTEQDGKIDRNLLDLLRTRKR